MSEMIDIVSNNPALGLATVLLFLALILSILKKLVKVAALTLIVIGGLVYILQSQGQPLPDAIESANDGIEKAAESLSNVRSRVKTTIEETQDAVETLRDKLPDADPSKLVDALEEPAKTVGKALQNTANSAAETGKKLPSTLKDILPKAMQPVEADDNAAEEPEEQTVSEKKQELNQKMKVMIKKRSDVLKERIKNATDSARGN